MDAAFLFLLAADAILFVHMLFAAFVVLGLLSIFIGKWLSWGWVCNPWFRMLHLAGITVVVLQSWLGIICPLTTWEMLLRVKAGNANYVGSFISHWLEVLLYYQAPEWVFIACYTVFGILVLFSWHWVRPAPVNRGGQSMQSEK